MAWILRAEFEYLLCLTSERLDLAKSRALLHASLDTRLLLTDDPLYRAYIDAGKKALHEYLKEGKDKQGLGWQSRTFQAAVAACICDDVNLAHVFNVLRVEELLENLGDEITPSQCAKVVLAIIGELYLVRRDMQEAKATESSEFREFKERNNRFLKKALELLISLIAESGRDRFCYVKEALIHPDATCPRPTPVANVNFGDSSPANTSLTKAWRGREPFQLAEVLRADLEANELYTASMYSLYRRGDPVFETLMHSGSLLSLWHRLHAICKRHTSMGQDTIKWSVVRQAPRLNRLRQLIFTRLLQCLSQMLFEPCLGSSTNLDEKKNLECERALARLLAESLLLSGVKVWCYENQRQKQQIVSMASQSQGSLSFKLDSLLCIQIDRGFVEFPLGQDLPDLDGLARLFAEVPGNKPIEPYQDMQYTDTNLYQLVPDMCNSGIRTPNWPSTCSLVGSRLHRAAPNMGIPNESRFFTNPMVTALLNKKALEEAINSFITTDAVQTV